MTRLRQAVLAARDLDATVATLRSELGLGEPFHDEAVGYFGLRNAVFALGDTFLEVVSPVRDDAPAGRFLDRRGADAAGYMLMAQVDDVAGARERAAQLGLREVFAVELDDITEAHLHPADVGGAILSISEPRPATAWRWGGPGWPARSVAGGILGVTVAGARDERWRVVLGDVPALVLDDGDGGLTEVRLDAPCGPGRSVVLGDVCLLTA